MSLHHGSIVEKAIRRSSRSITDIAKSTNLNRRSIYNYFNQKRLKPSLIISIGTAIQFDFSEEIPELKSNKNHIDVTFEKEDYWKSRYIDLLEKYNAILQHTFDPFS